MKTYTHDLWWFMTVMLILSLMVLSSGAHARGFNLKASDALWLSKKAWNDTADFDPGVIDKNVNDSMVYATSHGWSMVNVGVDNSCKWVLTHTHLAAKLKSLGYQVRFESHGNLECHIEIKW